MTPDRQKGFSLIEVLVVVAIATSLVLIVSNISGNVSGLNTLIGQELQSKSDINQTMQIINSEIRSAEPAQNGAYAIAAASTSSFMFYSDINKNGLAERVRYYISSSSIYRGVIVPVGTPATYPTSSETVTDILDNISVTSSTPLFAYYDANYTGTQAPMSAPVTIANIRLVGITFTTVAGGNQSSTPQYFSTIVGIRNLRSN